MKEVRVPTTTWMNLINIVLSGKRKQKREGICVVLSHILKNLVYGEIVDHLEPKIRMVVLTVTRDTMEIFYLLIMVVVTPVYTSVKASNSVLKICTFYCM